MLGFKLMEPNFMYTEAQFQLISNYEGIIGLLIYTEACFN